jgi:hypothetical protein
MCNIANGLDSWKVEGLRNEFGVSLHDKTFTTLSKKVMGSEEALRALDPFRASRESIDFRIIVERGHFHFNLNQEKDGVGALIWHEVKSLQVTSEADRLLQLSQKCTQAFQETDKARCQEEVPKPRTRLAKIAEKVSLTSDMNSLMRNSLAVADKGAHLNALTGLGKATSKVISVAHVISFSSAAGGLMNMFTGLMIARGGKKQLERAWKVGDTEGKVLGATNVAMGTSLVGLGGGTATLDLVALSHAVTSASKAVVHFVAPIIVPAAFVFYGFLWLTCFYELAQNYRFHRKLDADKKLLQTIRGFQVQLSSDESKGFQKKWDLFARRTSVQACQLGRKTLTPQFLRKLEQAIAKQANGSATIDDEVLIREAKSLVAKVKAANNRQMFKQAFVLFIAVLGILALVGSLVMSGGIAAPVLFAISALLWVVVDYVRRERPLYEHMAVWLFPDDGSGPFDRMRLYFKKRREIQLSEQLPRFSPAFPL